MSQGDESLERFALPCGLPFTLDMRQTATMLHLSLNGCYEAARRGEIPTLRIGRRLVVPTQALLSLLGCSVAEFVAREAGDE